MNDYRKKLGKIWPDLTTFLDRNKVKNFSIWNAEDLIFGYYENEDGAKLSEEEVAAKDRGDAARLLKRQRDVPIRAKL